MRTDIVLTVDAKRTALMLVDMQNDFLHPKGAYGRAGQSCDAIAALPPRLRHTLTPFAGFPENVSRQWVVNFVIRYYIN